MVLLIPLHKMTSVKRVRSMICRAGIDPNNYRARCLGEFWEIRSLK
jgi:hypothetical protein